MTAPRSGPPSAGGRLPRAPRGAPARTGARAGFTLIEMMAAMMLLSIGLLAIAGLAATAARAVRGGSTQTVAAAIAQARFDSLSSVRCQPLLVAGTTSGTAVTRGVRESWVARAQTNGAAQTNSLRLEVTLTVPGRASTLQYVSVVPCRRTA